MKTGFAILPAWFFVLVSLQAFQEDINYVHAYTIRVLRAGHDHTDTTIQPKDTMNIIAPGATLQLVSSQFGFTEGPAANKKGDVYFTDQPNDRIWKYSTKGKLSVFLDKAGRSNGLYFDKKGNLISCADEKNQLWSINTKGKITVLLTGFGGQIFNGPNDLWVHPKGQIYFTDPYYQRDYWERKSPDIKGEKLFYLPAGKNEAVVADENLLKPNGIIGTSDGGYLYVADIKDSKTYRYNISANGSLTGRQLFVEQGSDGMAIDKQGNIYLTGKGVTVYNAIGKKIAQIDVPAKWTANVCFGGAQKNILFITASESLYTLQMQVQGAE
ncbi:MAG: SMP-30/gluconolactonase/LRE family protein [Chitinophagaceae bacterium]|nr:SMP-30/gluconolactonase/LRE family protein [Chitinophagaceae bacterium]